MAEHMRPTSKEKAPDPSDSYERSHPEHEAGMGRLDNNTNATPRAQHDHMPDGAKNAQDPSRQINAQDAPDPRRVPNHSMKDEEPLGWDTAPQDIKQPRNKRQPRTSGKGGTP